MEFRYEYIVHTIDIHGLSTVEYKSTLFGSVTKVFHIPYYLGEEAVRQKIIEKFPHDIYYGRWMSIQKDYEEKRHAASQITGEIIHDFDDYFYTMQVNVVDMLSEKKDH